MKIPGVKLPLHPAARATKIARELSRAIFRERAMITYLSLRTFFIQFLIKGHARAGLNPCAIGCASPGRVSTEWEP